MVDSSVGDPWHIGADPYLLIDLDPTPDPTLFVSDFKDAKKKFLIFFLITYPQAHYIQSVKPNADETA